jgi:NO-binding membrane sensor protein with MHYT domain
MGLTIWTMHFVSMMSFSLPIQIQYNIPLTIASMIPAILAAYAAFYTLYKIKRSWWTFCAASIITGLGIVMMHYIGMRSITVSANIVIIPFISFYRLSLPLRPHMQRFVPFIILPISAVFD